MAKGDMTPGLTLALGAGQATIRLSQEFTITFTPGLPDLHLESVNGELDLLVSFGSTVYFTFVKENMQLLCLYLAAKSCEPSLST